MKKTLSLLYGLAGWAGFLLLFLYMIGFLGNFLVPKNVNSGLAGPAFQALLINLFLIALFGIHHSVAARPWFKQWIVKYIPNHLERSTYVIMSDVLLLLIFLFWQPMTGVVWHVDSAIGKVILYSVFALGWFLVVLSSFLIDHFDLLGMRQVFLYALGKPYTQVPFKLTFLYKIVRHPLMLGWFLGFWSTPHMTAGHLVFASGMTLYGLIGTFCEERTLLKHLGEDYRSYRERTPAIIPFLKVK